MADRLSPANSPWPAKQAMRAGQPGAKRLTVPAKAAVCFDAPVLDLRTAERAEPPGIEESTLRL